MKQAPAFQFYAKDFLTGTADMSNAEVGAYIRLLCHQWDKGALPDDEKKLVRYCNGDGEGLEIAKEKFEKGEDGLLRNKRLKQTKQELDEYKLKQSEFGKKGAEKRHKNIGYPTENVRVPQKNPSRVNVALLSASSTAYKKLSSQQIFETMRISHNRQTYSDELLNREAAAFYEKYRNSNIKNVGSLVSSWMNNVRPDIEPKKMIV